MTGPGTAGKESPLDGLEARWRAVWAEQGTYRFDPGAERSAVYSIDTPPPTVSGDLHPGHCSSYSHTDFIARYKRMRGLEVFYPMGWDDNGLNVERRVQIMLGISCDPSLPYDPGFTPRPAGPKDRPVPVSRRNFIEACAIVTEQLEQKYFELWSDLGLSVDWSRTYRTIGPEAITTSQASFLDLARRGLAYRSEAPTLWDVDFRTAVAQAELQERAVPSQYHRLLFGLDDGTAVEVDTTRPELLPACVALVVHPDDPRSARLAGRRARTPLFGVPVPVLAHRLADPDKGTGIAMVCTFGDTTDVTWWRELTLPVRPVLGTDGRLLDQTPGWIVDEAGAAAYRLLAGRTVRQARRELVGLLQEAGQLRGDPRAVEHPVKFWENGSSPLEIVTNHQWFVRLPGQDVLLDRGRQLRWWPEQMRVRYENWVNGLVGDWNITRQRYFGVPFPVWYPVAEDGSALLTSPILAAEESLPVDPTVDTPAGFRPEQRDRPGGFTADPDVMDTWATSSLSPRIVAGGGADPDLFARVYPMDLRPQAHEIIRTWLFYSVVRAEYADGDVPWRDVAISGFVTDPDRKKLSKSAANSPDDPARLIETFGADAVRYWAAGGRPGLDITFDRNRMKVGRRLATKLLNVSRLVRGFAEPGPHPTRPLDAMLLDRLDGLVREATADLEQYDYARALSSIESFFWFFCDDYVELVKVRAYEQDASAAHTLRTALDVLVRLLAPFLPFVTEEVWSGWGAGSVHRSPWPEPSGPGSAGLPPALALAATVLREVRGAKSRAHVSLTAPVSSVTVQLPQDRHADLETVRGDLAAAGRIQQLLPAIGDVLEVVVDLG